MSCTFLIILLLYICDGLQPARRLFRNNVYIGHSVACPACVILFTFVILADEYFVVPVVNYI
jgi:hypothetical protein